MAPRSTNRLTALRVSKATNPGMYADGGGLYLQVTGVGARSWIYRFSLAGRSREMGLGPLSLLGLQEARAKALEARRMRHEGIDPIEARHAARMRQQLEAAKAVAFKDCAEAYIKVHRAAWHNEKHAGQWATTLATYAEPVFGSLSVQAIDTALVLKVIEPIWATKAETAGRLRGRIEAVLDWATVRGYRSGDNPARWRGHLDKLLPARSKVRKVVHHAAIPYGELPGFLADLRGQEGVAARALEFTILTAARTGETIGSTWDEINFAEKVWIVPAERMKAGKEHRVPLCARAMALADEMSAGRDSGEQFVFPGGRRGKPLSNMGMVMTLRRMGRECITVHGFRSSFRDWAAERTSFPSEVVEMALAHAVGDKVEGAYRRGDLFEKRRRLMQQWATFCTTAPAQKPQSTVTPLRRKA
jgi:integrase